MSEEKRFIKNKKVFALSISLIAVCGLAGVFGISFVLTVDKHDELSGDYDNLYEEYEILLNDFNELDDQYFILTGEHIELKNNFNDLLDDYNALQTSKELLQTQYNNLLIDFTTLSDDYDDLDLLYNILQTDFNTLNESKDALQLLYDNLSEDYGILEDDYATLLSTYNTLQTDYTILLSNFNELLGNYTILSSDYNALQDVLDELQTNFNLLQIDYDNLFTDYGILEGNYNDLINDYDLLSDAFDELQITLDALQIAYDYVTDTIRQSILPVQYSIFAEAARRYYLDIYLEGLWELDEKEYWMAFVEFCRDVILHDSYQHNLFSIVSNAFSDALIFGNDTMQLANYIMYWTFWDWLPYWGLDLTSDELLGINIIVDWCIDEIDYEYDLDIIDGQEYFNWDYIKFPVETAFRTMGDCEDQAILTATYLESCGFETAIIINHDSNHPTYGEFYHGTLWVHIDNPSDFWSLYPDSLLWSIDGGVTLWSWIDTTWDIPFGSTPAWLQDYIDYGTILSWDIISLAICDIGGTINTNVGENLGLTYVMPT